MAARCAGIFFFLLAASATAAASDLASGAGLGASTLGAGVGAVDFFLAAYTKIVSIVVGMHVLE
jgi:hypothetical protein